MRHPFHIRVYVRPDFLMFSSGLEMSVIPMKFDIILLKQASNTHLFTQKFANSDILSYLWTTRFRHASR